MNENKVDSALIIQEVDATVNRVRTRALDVSFNELFDMHKTGELIINPDFQRLFRWSEFRQSQFIESLILELPVPPIYVIEIEDGVYELIDGLQRVSSYFHFRGLNPNAGAEGGAGLVLQGCDLLPKLNKLTYDTLPHATQIKLKRHFIRMEVLRRESDPRLRYHMFKRLNTGGELLSPQEIRNCTIRLLDSKFNDFLKELSKTTDYLTCMTELTPEKREKMYLEEYVLRFYALKNNQSQYVKDIAEFLTLYMESISDPEATNNFSYDKERAIFLRTFQILSNTLGDTAFSGFNDKGNAQGYFSALHFEALTLGLQKHLDDINDAQLEKVKAALLAIKTDKEFKRLTTGGGKNYAAALKTRIEFVSQKVGLCLK